MDGFPRWGSLFSPEGECRDTNGGSRLDAGLLVLQLCQSELAKNISATIASDSAPGKVSLEMLL